MIKFAKFGVLCWLKVKLIKQKVDRKEEEDMVELPQPLKQKLTNEIIELLSGLNQNGGANSTLQHGKFIFSKL